MQQIPNNNPTSVAINTVNSTSIDTIGFLLNAQLSTVPAEWLDQSKMSFDTIPRRSCKGDFRIPLPPCGQSSQKEKGKDKRSSFVFPFSFFLLTFNLPTFCRTCRN